MRATSQCFELYETPDSVLPAMVYASGSSPGRSYASRRAIDVLEVRLWRQNTTLSVKGNPLHSLIS